MQGPLQKKAAVAASLMLTFVLCVETFTPVLGQPAAPAVKAKAREKPKAKAAPTAPLDLNKASAEQLQETLPGVGEVTARKIVAGRPYSSVDGLAKAGLPARTIAEIRPFVTVSAPPMTKPKAAASTKPTVTAAPAAKVDLNTATAAELEALPGVGPAHARDIIAARPFKSVNDLERVKGLTKARVDAIRDHVTLAPPADTAPFATKAMAKTKTATVNATKPVTPAPVATPATAVAKPATKSKAAIRPATGSVVNLNTATREELETLPGIGPVKAAAILEYRQATPFRTKEDVMKVRGIKEGEFAKIKDLITVE